MFATRAQLVLAKISGFRFGLSQSLPLKEPGLWFEIEKWGAKREIWLGTRLKGSPKMFKLDMIRYTKREVNSTNGERASKNWFLPLVPKSLGHGESIVKVIIVFLKYSKVKMWWGRQNKVIFNVSYRYETSYEQVEKVQQNTNRSYLEKYFCFSKLPVFFRQYQIGNHVCRFFGIWFVRSNSFHQQIIPINKLGKFVANRVT